MNFDSLCDAIIEEILQVCEINVERDTLLLEGNALDSFAMLSLIGLLEDRLSIDIDPDSLSSRQFTSVEVLATWALSVSGQQDSG